MSKELGRAIKQLTEDTIQAPDIVKCLPQKIFLCGGEIASTGGYKSARDYIYRNIKAQNLELFEKIILAEEVVNWFDVDNIYQDLLELEKDLAGLVASIPLFLEGPGAIAELGAFTQVDEIHNKLLVILTQDHYNRKSFIRLGPIRHTENLFKRKKKIFRFVWINKKNGKFDSSSFSPHIGKITKIIKKSLNEASKHRQFKREDNAHKILLACDLINIFHACKLNELRRALKAVGITVKKKELKNYLKMAENLNLVSHLDDGTDADTLYFIPDPLSQEDFIQYKFKPNVQDGEKDKARWKAKFKIILDKDKDRSSKIERWRLLKGITA